MNETREFDLGPCEICEAPEAGECDCGTILCADCAADMDPGGGHYELHHPGDDEPDVDEAQEWHDFDPDC